MTDIKLATYEDLQNEIATREANVNSLADRIDRLPGGIYADLRLETQEREIADNDLSEHIDSISAGIRSELQTEIQARINADAALRERVDGIPDVTENIRALQEADRTINARITQSEADITNLGAEKLKKHIVQELPSDSIKFDFNDGLSRFTNDYRTECIVENDEIHGYHQTIRNNGNSNTYRRAFFNCADIMRDATRMVVEFDFLISNRWHIGLVDLEQRPGGSTGSNYTSPGVAFYLGTSDDAYLNICGVRTNVAIKDVWLSAKIILDFNRKITEYTIRNQETGVLETSGTVPFKDTDVAGISGFETYTWYTGTMKLDNLKIISIYDAQDNVVYLIPVDDEKTLAYVYVDNKPRLIGDNSKNMYSAEPMQIGTWMDGTPIWRVGFQNRPIPYDSTDPTLYNDMSYTPFYDYENKRCKYVRSINDVLILNGLFQLDASGCVVIGNHWNAIEYDFDISHLVAFLNHETLYFTGYVEFVTPYNNIQGG